MAHTKEEAKELVEKKVKEFDAKIKSGEAEEYSEDDIEEKFIIPLFKALGWGEDDIIRQKTILKGRPDYRFKLENKNVFVIEAKRAGLRLVEIFGRQAVSYAWHNQIPFAILTNFKEIKVYHALSNLKNIDKQLIWIKDFDYNGYFRLNYKDFIERFDILWLLSKESFKKDILSKYISKREKRILKSVDKSILDDLLKFRKIIGQSIKDLNPDMQNKPELIDECVQHLIVRLIFIRSTEDRKLEKEDLLLGYLREAKRGIGERLYPRLKKLFVDFNNRYNSKLFREHLTDESSFKISEDVLIKVIWGLYFGAEGDREKYNFDMIPVDLFGSIYEQYLGVILRETEKTVRLEKGPAKRKAMGIYYTPTYIVNYIVKNTVGEYMKNKTIDEILKVKILDPACGSGSFLQKAFSEVCNIIEEKLKKGEKSQQYKHSFRNYKEKLTLGEKITIMVNCIFGVDLDEKAVELAQLSLLLKLLEGETSQTKKMLLPTMTDTIKCGNSLIDDPEIAKDKAFNWQANFTETFKQRGFDIVIGNPPWVTMRGKQRMGISNLELDYYLKKYIHSAEYKVNSFALFIEKSIGILKEGGTFGFIIPSTILTNQYLGKIRKLILTKTNLKSILFFGKSVFKEGVADSIILIFERRDRPNLKKNVSIYTNILNLDESQYKIKHLPQEDFLKNENFIFNIYIGPTERFLLDKIEKSSFHLSDIIKNYVGVVTGDNKKFIANRKLNITYRKILLGEDLKRYFYRFNSKYVLFDKKKLWSNTDERVFLKKEKILLRKTGIKLIAAYDNEQYFTEQTIYNLFLKKQTSYNLKYFLGMLNSSLMQYYFLKKLITNPEAYPYIKGIHIDLLPIHIINFDDIKQKIFHDKIVHLVVKMLELKKEYHKLPECNKKDRINQQINQIDYEINEEVYKLYGITEKEKKIIEESLK